MTEDKRMPIVVIDELPKTCLSCDLFVQTMYEGYDFCIFSQFADEEIKKANYYEKLAKRGIRPSWCPLITEEELLRKVQSPFRDWAWSNDE